MKPSLRLVPPALAILLLVLASGARAQEEWKWPEKPKNLKVLPADFTGARLRPIMTGFTRALGVRCEYCHVGEAGKPLSTFDFASDANPNKDRAREMYKMLGEINQHLKKIPPSGEKRVNMWCHTCHYGRPRPTTLEEEMAEAYRKSGVNAALSRYRELREKFYGRAGYDFSERALNGIGYELLGTKENDAAIAIFRENAAQFPKSANAWDSLAEGYLAAGDRAQAAANYRKALELDPKFEHALQQLKKLEEKKD
jgi:tetratricopeptide (TPR) repeat protein